MKIVPLFFFNFYTLRQNSSWTNDIMEDGYKFKYFNLAGDDNVKRFYGMCVVFENEERESFFNLKYPLNPNVIDVDYNTWRKGYSKDLKAIEDEFKDADND